MTLTEKTLGKRLKAFREILNLKQEELAKKLEMDRVSLSSIENDKRSIKADELILLSKAFNISIDELLNLENSPKVILERPLDHKTQSITVSQQAHAKFKETLLYILIKIGAQPTVDEISLYHILYFIDFTHYEKFRQPLLGATYLKNPQGPTPIEFQAITAEMITSSEIEIIKSAHFQKKYLPLRAPDLSLLNGNELQTIDFVLQRFAQQSAAQIVESLQHNTPWLETQDRQKIEYDLIMRTKCQ